MQHMPYTCMFAYSMCYKHPMHIEMYAGHTSVLLWLEEQVCLPQVPFIFLSPHCSLLPSACLVKALRPP